MKQYAVGVIQNKEGKVLLLRRSWSAPWQDYKWSFPGGTIEVGEEPIEALVRELKEEIAIDVKESECSHFLTVTEENSTDKYVTHYFRVWCEKLSEENIILNFEHDKYQFVEKEKAGDEELIPNLDVVFEYLISGGEQIQPSIENINITKGFINLLQPNPFDIEKGVLDTSKLKLKEVTDKLGRKMKKWVRAEEPQKKERTKKQEDQPKHSGVNYHSIYSDMGKVITHAQNSSPEQLQEFIEREKGNLNAKKLVDIAQKELDARGINSPSSKSPFGESKKPKPSLTSGQKVESDEAFKKRGGEDKPEPKPEKKKDEVSKQVQEHLDVLGVADDENDLVNYLPHVDKDKKLSSDEKDHVKSKIYEHIGKLTHQKLSSGKGGKSEEKKEEKKPEIETPKKKIEEIKKEKSENLDKLSDEEKEKRGWKKQKDGYYNPETGEGWKGDQSIKLKDGEKREIQTTADKIVSNVKTLFTPGSTALMNIISGKAGVGKTFNTVKAVEDMGFEKVDKNIPFDPKDYPNGSYVEIKGTRSNYSDFLSTLFKFRGEEGSKTLINFDDSDSMLFNPETINLLKNIEGDNPVITIPDTYKKKIADSLGISRDEVPNEFKFNSKINFITNKKLPDNQDTAAIKGRSSSVHIDLNKDQMLYSLSNMLPHMKNDGKKDFKATKELYDELVKNQHLLKEDEFQSRTLSNVIHQNKLNFGNLPEETKSQYKDWKEYNIELMKTSHDHSEKEKKGKLKKGEDIEFSKALPLEVIMSFENLILGN